MMRPRFFVDVDPGPGSPAADEEIDFGAATERRPATATETPATYPVVHLSPNDSRHARTVLRARTGDPCEIVFSSRGVVAEAVFVDVADPVTVRVTAWVPSGRPSRVRLLLVQGLPQPKKVDEVIEKGTEVGVDSFLVAPAAGSPRVPWERLQGRLERWRAVAREAAKQSKQSGVPDLRAVGSLDEAVALVHGEGWRSVVLLPDAADHLGEVLTSGRGPHATATAEGVPADPGRDAPERWALWVGPEGGWSAEESEALAAAGCLPATLGGRVLRTETAGPVAAALARYALSDW